MATTYFPAEDLTQNGMGPINNQPGSSVYKILTVKNLGPNVAYLSKDDQHAEAGYLHSDTVLLDPGDQIELYITGTDRYWYGAHKPGVSLIVVEETVTLGSP